MDIECLPGGTMIESYNGPLAIENIKENNLLLTGSGKWRKVTATSVNYYNCSLFDIYVRGQRQIPLRITSNHPIAIALMSSYDKRDINRKRIPRQLVDLVWKRADEVKCGEWIVFPKPEEKHSLEQSQTM